MFEYHEINDFSGGLNTVKDPRDIRDNELSVARGIFVDNDGIIRTGANGKAAAGVKTVTGVKTPGSGIFYYETDHVGGSQAKDSGARWVASIDAQNGQVDLREIDRDISYTIADLGSADSYTPGAGKITFDGINKLIDSDSKLITLGLIKRGDVIRITGCTTVTANNRTFIVKSVKENELRPEGAVFSNDQSEAGNVTLTRLVIGVYYSSDDILRICDGAFNANTKSKMYGYIKRIHFKGAGSTPPKKTFDNWFANDQTLAPPTYLQIHASAYPTAGLGFNITCTDVATAGTWDGKTYQIAMSWVYDGNQESLLYIPGSNNVFTTTNNQYIDLDIRGTGDYNERISGARIYCRVSGSNDAWVLFADISMRNGVRTKLDSTYNPWADGTTPANKEVKSDTTISFGQNVVTYEMLNGFSSDEFDIDFNTNGEGYRTAIIANRRVFIANINIVNPNDDGSTLIQLRDRIMYTPINRFDTFPRTFFVDVIRGDADEYTVLAEYADRLFAFKRETLYIINIASPSPSNWFLEKTIKGRGIKKSCQVCNTPYGLFWANNYGSYWYDGNSLKDISIEKIKVSSWNISSIEFDRLYNILLISGLPYDVQSVNISESDGDLHAYHLRTKSWTLMKNILDVNKGIRSNFIIIDGELYYSSTTHDSTVSQNYKIDLISSNQSVDKILIVTKDIDFGNPGKIKKIYGLTIVYKSNALQTTPISYLVNASGSWVNFIGNFGVNSGWTTLNCTLSSPIECQSLRIEVTNPTNLGTISINHILIKYRVLSKRIS